MAKLTPKQQAFCDYYIETGNATEAARRAGFLIAVPKPKKPAAFLVLQLNLEEMGFMIVKRAEWEQLQRCVACARGEGNE